MTILRASALMLLLMTALTGIIYPLLLTGLARILFPFQADGSLLVEDGRVIGSSLIGRQFDDPKYFWPRPSATVPFPYNAALSSGSNFGPLNGQLMEAKQSRARALRAAGPENREPAPADLITASASGLDPHISPEAARFQALRVARARQMDPNAVLKLIDRHTQRRQLGFLGEPAVNVLLLNRALDAH